MQAVSRRAGQFIHIWGVHAHPRDGQPISPHTVPSALPTPSVKSPLPFLTANPVVSCVSAAWVWRAWRRARGGLPSLPQPVPASGQAGAHAARAARQRPAPSRRRCHAAAACEAARTLTLRQLVGRQRAGYDVVEQYRVKAVPQSQGIRDGQICARAAKGGTGGGLKWRCRGGACGSGAGHGSMQGQMERNAPGAGSMGWPRGPHAQCSVHLLTMTGWHTRLQQDKDPQRACT